MTEQRSFKRIVRDRMEKTGESYTAARTRLLAGPGDGGPASVPEAVMPVAETRLRERTGRGWEDWFDLLDGWGAGERNHTEIALHLREKRDVEGWWSQAITVAYERARGRRAVGEHADGFSVTAQKTVNVGVEQLFDVFMDEASRGQWLADGQLSLRTATRPKSARFDWGDGSTRVIVDFEDKGKAKSTVALAHERLRDAVEAERIKAMWRGALSTLKGELEGGNDEND